MCCYRWIVGVGGSMTSVRKLLLSVVMLTLIVSTSSHGTHVSFCCHSSPFKCAVYSRALTLSTAIRHILILACIQKLVGRHLPQEVKEEKKEVLVLLFLSLWLLVVDAYPSVFEYMLRYVPSCRIIYRDVFWLTTYDETVCCVSKMFRWLAVKVSNFVFVRFSLLSFLRKITKNTIQII